MVCNRYIDCGNMAHDPGLNIPDFFILFCAHIANSAGIYWSINQKGGITLAAKNRFSKPVAFNHTMAEDQKILAHIEGRNFSGYVKDLIMADIQRGKAAAAQNRPSDAAREGGKQIIRSNEKGGIKIVIG